MSKKEKDTGGINAVLIGVKGGILSSLCCIPVIILVPLLVILGAESFALAFAFTKYRTYFIILGFAFVVFSIRTALKRKYGCCDIGAVKANKIVIAVALLTQITFFITTYYLILPAISNFVFTRGIAQDNEQVNFLPPLITETTSTSLPETTTLSTTSTSTTSTPKQSCFDGVKNQGEEYVDCGGPCSACGTIGVGIKRLDECNSMKYNDLYLILENRGVRSRNWGVKDAADYFTITCDGTDIKSFHLEREYAGGHYSPRRMKADPIPGDYRIRIACEREFGIKDARKCMEINVEIAKGRDTGVGIYTQATTSTSTTQSQTTTSTSIPPKPQTSSTTIKKGYRTLTLELNTYCPTCVPAAKYLLVNTRGVAQAKFPDPKAKIWIITYNPGETSPDKIMSRVRDFDPNILEEP